MTSIAHHRTTHVPVVTLVIAVALPILTYVIQHKSSLPPYEVGLLFGAVPAHITTGQELWSLVTSGFVHLSQGHLIPNLFILCIAGAYFERQSGPKRTLALVLAGITAGALAHALAYPESDIPLYGISAGALALAGAASVTATLRHTSREIHVLILICVSILGAVSLFYGLLPALKGGVPMPIDLVESGVAHLVGIGLGLAVGVGFWSSRKARRASGNEGGKVSVEGD